MRVVIQVCLSVKVASVIAKPHIITSFCQGVGRRSRWKVCNPAVGGIKQTMLHEDDRWLLSTHHSLVFDPVNCQLPTVFSGSGVDLVTVARLLYIFNHGDILLGKQLVVSHQPVNPTVHSRINRTEETQVLELLDA